MKRIYSFMVAAVASFAAISCTQELQDNNQLPEGEVVVFEATVDGAGTKAVLDGTVSKWEETDKITIISENGAYEFATSADDLSDDATSATFKYVGDDFAGTKFMAVYPAGNYTLGEAEKTVKANIPTFQGAVAGSFNPSAALAVAYSEDNSLEFKNATALIKFTIKGSNIKSIEFYGNASEPISGDVLVSMKDDNTLESVKVLDTELKTEDGDFSGKPSWIKIYSQDEANGWCFADGTTYYAAIAPQDFEEGVSVNYILADNSKIVAAKTTANPVSVVASTILNIGTLEYDANKVDASAYGLVGSFQGWDPANSIAMEYVSDGWIVARNVKLYKDDSFKFLNGKTWDDVNYGASSVLEDGVPAKAVKGGSDIMVGKNGIHDLYLNPNAEEVKAICVEEYTDLMVTITIDNKANWSPLYIYLEKNGTPITLPDGNLVSGTTYAVSGDYIGETLKCKFFSGSKVSKEEEVTVTKNGGNVPVVSAEEVKAKLYLVPNSNWKIDNARFAAYFFGNGEKWVSMKLVNGKYECEIQDGYPNVIFCRMNPSTTANNWNNKWNQTADLVIPTNGNNTYTVKADTWDKGGGTWSKTE